MGLPRGYPFRCSASVLIVSVVRRCIKCDGTGGAVNLALPIPAEGEITFSYLVPACALSSLVSLSIPPSTFCSTDFRVWLSPRASVCAVMCHLHVGLPERNITAANGHSC